MRHLTTDGERKKKKRRDVQTDGRDVKINPIKVPASRVNLVMMESKDSSQLKTSETPLLFFLFHSGKNQMVQFVKVGRTKKKNLAAILASCHSYFAFVCLCKLLFPAQTPLCKQRRRDNWLTAQSAVASQASLIPHSGRSDWKMKDECSFPRERAGTLRLAVAPLCSPMG